MNRNLDACINTAGDLSTSDENLVELGSLTPEFCTHVFPGWVHTGLSHASGLSCLDILQSSRPLAKLHNSVANLWPVHVLIVCLGTWPCFPPDSPAAISR